MSVFTRLLASLHAAVFDTSPVAAVAFRLAWPGGTAVWSVADETLTVTADGSNFSYALSDLTVSGLIGLLESDGFTVVPGDSTLLSLSAAVLLEMSGSSAVVAGDRVMAMKNDLLRSLFGGYARELRAATLAVTEAIKQMVIQTSTGEWLNRWGALYGVKRKSTHTDTDFADYIPQEVVRERVNNYAIQQAILDETQQSIYIREPWRDMFRLDSTSQLSSQNRFYDGSTVGPHLIQPIAYGTVDWAEIPAIIDRNRAAGVIMMDPEEQFRRGVIEPSVGPIAFAEWSCYVFTVKADDYGTLDRWLYPSAYEITPNSRSLITSVFYRELVAGENATYADVTLGITDGYVTTANLTLAVGGVGDQFMDNGLVIAYPDGDPAWDDLTVWTGEQAWDGAYNIRTGFASTIDSSTWLSQTTWPAKAWSSV